MEKGITGKATVQGSAWKHKATQDTQNGKQKVMWMDGKEVPHWLVEGNEGNKKSVVDYEQSSSHLSCIEAVTLRGICEIWAGVFSNSRKTSLWQISELPSQPHPQGLSSLSVCWGQARALSSELPDSPMLQTHTPLPTDIQPQSSEIRLQEYTIISTLISQGENGYTSRMFQN